MYRNLVTLVLVFCALSQVESQCDATFNFDMHQETQPWDHYWENCVGSGHALLGLRSDWQQHLKIVHEDLGFKFVRFHAILDDDMSVVLMDGNKVTYSFYNVDTVFDFLVSIGMKPIVELSFMPAAIARDPSKTIFHYKGIISPPKDWNAWTSLVTAFVTHLIDRYGMVEVASWYFEVWNEPNCGFWSGTYQEYFHLLAITTEAIHALNPILKVGGPATCQVGLITETMEYIKNGSIKLDFISTHLYPTDFNPTNNTVMKTVITHVRNMVGNYPLFFTEYNDGLYSDPPYHDTSYASSYIIKTVVDVSGLVDVFAWWTFSDIFEEGGQVSGLYNKSTGWGLLSLYTIPKPSFRAFQLLHETGNTRIISKPDPNYYPSVGVLGTSNSSHLTIHIWNHDTPTAPLTPKTVCIVVSPYSNSSLNSAQLRRIDDDHANPFTLWQSLGQPVYPSHSQILELTKAAEFVIENQPVTVSNGVLQFSIVVPPQGVAAVVIPVS